MVYGIQLALDEISLVLFTTLAPSGAVALMLMGMPMLFGRASDHVLQRINRFMCIPLVVSMVGLVMSATHLGNPENVLYVFARVGASPLSNEVAGAAAFLLLAGVYWLYSFVQKPRLVLQRVWFALLCCAGVAFVVLIAYAYAADTIIAWSTMFVPLNLMLNSLVGGPLLALASLYFAGLSASGEREGSPVDSRVASERAGILPVRSGAACASPGATRASFVSLRFLFALPILSFLAVTANVVCMVLQNAGLTGIGNEFATVSQLVPFYGVAIALFALLCVSGVCLCTWSLRKKGRAARAASIVGCVCAFAGIFVTRVSFYAMHLTVGLGM